MHNTSYYKQTKHSEVRSNQRGIKSEVLDAVWQYADGERPRGGGCFELFISRKELSLLVRKGRMTAQLAGKCSRTKLLTNGETLITVYKNDN